MGKFDYLRLNLACTHGYYSIKDSNGVDFLLYVDFQNGKNSEFKSKDYVNAHITNKMTGMRIAAPNNKNFKIVRNEFEYRYYASGELGSICWYKNGVEFKLSGDLSEYPLTQTPGLISKLLSLDEAVANEAFSQILQSLDAR